LKKFIFILGGTRSGKSSYAVALAKKLNKKTVFIATAAPLDKEMQTRIKLHKASRPQSWRVIEEEKNIDSVLSKISNKHKVVLIDCMGLLISNFLMSNLKNKEIEKRIKKLINIILEIKPTIILVSNEVGSGMVPKNPLARRFGDLLGWANQMMAKKADEVILMQSGIPVKIKNANFKKE